MGNADILGFDDVSDPYVVIGFGGNGAHRSLTVENSLNPTWNFQTVLQVASIMQMIRISVFDSDLAKEHDSMGDAAIPVYDIIREGPSLVKRRVTLSNIAHGEMELELH